MAAPKTPNVVAAAAKRRRQGQETMAEKLRAAGWTVTPPPERTNGGDALDHYLALSGQVANFRRHGDIVRMSFTPSPRVELSADDCEVIGAALMAAGAAIRESST